MAPRHATIALVIRYVATCYKRWAVAHMYGHRCRTPARILHAPGHAQTMRLCRFSVWWPLRQRQGGDAEAGWPIPAGPESARPPATIPQAGLGGERGSLFSSLSARGARYRKGATWTSATPSATPASTTRRGEHGEWRGSGRRLRGVCAPSWPGIVGQPFHSVAGFQLANICWPSIVGELARGVGQLGMGSIFGQMLKCWPNGSVQVRRDQVPR